MSATISPTRRRTPGRVATEPDPPRRGDRARVLRIALVVGVLGALLTALGALLEPRRTPAAYLVAWAAATWTVLGALLLAAVAALTRAGWMQACERPVRAIVRTLPLLALLFVPIALWAGVLYPWVPPLDGLPPEIAARVEAKRDWLNVPFWAGRAAAYFAVWLLAGWRLRRAREADRRASGAGALAVLALTTTLAAVDWLMSLAPHWASAAYGPYVLAGGVVAALSLASVLAWWVRRDDGAVADAEDPAGRRTIARGRLLLVALLAWLWIGFSQYLVVWSADLPVEVTWFLPRVRGAWGGVVLALLVLGGLAPAALLLVRDVVRRGAWLAGIGAWLLVVHWVHVAWLVLPEVQPRSAVPHWVDLAAVLAVAGLAVAFGVWRGSDE